jgi:hypothetical protein
MKKVKESKIIIDSDGDEVNVTNWIPLVVAGINPPKKAGATNANVSLVVDDGVRNEVWVDYSFIKQNDVTPGYTMWVKSFYKIGDLVTEYLLDGESMELETPKQRLGISREVVLQKPEGTAAETGPLTKYKG